MKDYIERVLKDEEIERFKNTALADNDEDEKNIHKFINQGKRTFTGMHQENDEGKFGGDKIEPKNKNQKIENNDSSRSITSSEKDDGQTGNLQQKNNEMKKIEQNDKNEMKVRVNFQNE
jgi:hypothetical protein